ncbi:MAG TPA: DUF1801 domain-containing protein [Hyphomonadaceae bacterium]|nr:DUF1801 domain-containing protein [Hyphomonadaceae bacterium]
MDKGEGMRGAPKAKSVEEYLSRLPAKQKAALEKLRGQIRAAAPGVEEYIGYGMPMFKLHGRLCAFSAFTHHLSFFCMSSRMLADYPELKDHIAGKGTLQFTPEKPLPAAAVKKLVKARVVQNLELEDERARKKKAKATKAKA